MVRNTPAPVPIQIAARALAGGPVLIGIAVLFAWALDVPTLKTVLPGLNSMKANAALCFVFTGSGLRLLHSRIVSPGERWAAALLGALAAALGALVLAQYATGLSFRVDELLFADPNTASPPFPGRMAPATALAFVFTGAAVLLLSPVAGSPGRGAGPPCAVAAHVLAAMAAAVGYISLAGYCFDIEGLYSFGPFVAVPLNTAAAFVMLAAAILLTAPELGWRRPFAHAPVALGVLTQLLPWSLGVPFAAGAVVMWGARTRLYDPSFGPALFALAAAASSIGLVWLAAGSVRRAERLLMEANAARERIERHQALLLELADHPRAHTPSEALATTAALLARHFGASRAGYGELDGAGELVSITHDWTDGAAPPVTGPRNLADFGTELADALRTGRTVVMPDLRTAAARPAGSGAGTPSMAAVPFAPGGQLRAMLYVARQRPQAWTPDELKLIEDVAVRTWATVERARAEAALGESEARLRATFEAAPVGIIFSEAPSGRLLYGNAAVDRIFRFPMRFSGTVAAYGEWEAYDAEGRRLEAQDYPLADTLAHGNPAHGEYLFPCGDGVRRWIAVTTAPLRDASGRLTGAVVVVADVDDARRLQRVLAQGKADLEALVEERTRDLQDTQTRLAHAQRIEALGQLAGGVAHDFNNVLQAVQGGASLIERRPADPEGVRRLARMVFEAASRGSAITRRLLAFSRRGDLRTEPVSPVALLTGMRDILTHTLGAGIGVRVDAAASLPPLLADKGQLETVLVNLATNARDAMAGNGVLTLAAAAETLSANHEWGLKPGSYIRLEVTDTGVGIPPDLLARVTEPFFTTKEPGKGTGLGLAMTRGFAEQSGGGLRVESTPGHGATVKLWFPVADVAPAASPLAPPDGADAERSFARLLVVDDDPIVREILVEQLEAAGYGVLAAAGGQAALDLLDTGEARRPGRVRPVHARHGRRVPGPRSAPPPPQAARHPADRLRHRRRRDRRRRRHQRRLHPVAQTRGRNRPGRTRRRAAGRRRRHGGRMPMSQGRPASRGIMAMRSALHTATLAVAVLTLSVPAAAQPAPLSFDVVHSWTDTGCRFAMLTKFPSLSGAIMNGAFIRWSAMTATWSGECANGSVSGPGFLRVSRDGNEMLSFEGTMQDGVPAGVGAYHLVGGMTLTGSFQGGRLADGHVVISTENGFLYDGGWKDDRPEGRGTMKHSAGGRYEGEWHNGQREGQGAYSWPSGNRYEGGWQADERSGRGVLVFADGGRFEGDWLHGKLSGHGVQAYPSGVRYEGEFNAGKRSGRGVMLLPNGDRLEGNWENDLLDGPGSYIGAGGDRFDGDLRAGWPNGTGVAVASHGRRYEGEWRDGLPNGEGTLTKAGMPPFTGTWVNGCFSDADRHAAFGMKPVSCPSQ